MQRPNMGPGSPGLQMPRVQNHGAQTVSQIYPLAVLRNTRSTTTAANELVHVIGLDVLSSSCGSSKRHIGLELVQLYIGLDHADPTAPNDLSIAHRRSQTGSEAETTATKQQ